MKGPDAMTTSTNPAANGFDGLAKLQPEYDWRDDVVRRARLIFTQWADEAHRAGDLPATWATDTVEDLASWCDPNAAFDIAAGESGAPMYGEGVSHDAEIDFLNACVNRYEETFCGPITDAMPTESEVQGSASAAKRVRSLAVGAAVIWDDGVTMDRGVVAFRSDDGLVIRWASEGLTRWHDWDTCTDYIVAR